MPVQTLFGSPKAKRYPAKDHDEMDAVPVAKEDAGAIEIFTPAEMRELLPFLAIGAFAGVRHSFVSYQVAVMKNVAQEAGNSPDDFQQLPVAGDAAGCGGVVWDQAAGGDSVRRSSCGNREVGSKPNTRPRIGFTPGPPSIKGGLDERNFSSAVRSRPDIHPFWGDIQICIISC